jgi:tetratricopeptide (TPR) repeat protein
MYMKKHFFIAAFLLYFSAEAQERLVRKALEKLKEGEYVSSLEYIRKYQYKEPQQPMGFYILSLWYVDTYNPSYNPDSAYSALVKSSDLYQLGESDKRVSGEDEFREYVKLLAGIPAFKDTIVELTYRYYDKVGTVDAYDYFSKRFKTTPQSALATRKSNHLRYLKAEEQNTLFAFRDFIENYPYADDIPKAWLGVYHLSFTMAVKRGTIDDFRQYIADYPSSPLVDSAWLQIYRLDYVRVERLNDIIEYENHLKTYPNSSYKELAIQNIHRLAAERAILINTPTSYSYFRQTYPDAIQIADIKAREEKVVWHSILLKEDKDLLLYYTSEFPEAANLHEAVQKLAHLIYPEFEDIDTEEGYDDFVSKYPNTEEASRAIVRISQIQYNKALEKYQENDYESALGFIDEAISRHRDSSIYHTLKARCHMMLDQLDEAIETYNTSLKMDSKSAQIYSERGFAYWRLKQLVNGDDLWDENGDKALSDFRACLRLDDRHGWSNYFMGTYFHKFTSDHRKALMHYRKALIAGIEEENLESNINELDEIIALEKSRADEKVVVEEVSLKRTMAPKVSTTNTTRPVNKKQYLPKETMERIQRAKTPKN